jgi:UPF0042 nucleotide-binding protein
MVRVSDHSHTEATPAQKSGLVVVTGLSGAGKSTALRALSDAGYYCIDNLPPPLADASVRVCHDGGIGRVALGMDVRVGAFLDTARDALDELEKGGDGVVVLFLEAADEVLVRRYSETRRPHPMLAEHHGDDVGVLDAVRLERERLAAIRHHATMVIDTSVLSVHELRRQVLATFASGEASPRLHVRVVSFGYKYGLPLDADVVFDVRFLDNPHFEPTLRDFTGEDPAVQRFVLSSPGASDLVAQLEELMVFSVPRYAREGKSYLTLAIGCTGGRHRSVVVAAELARRLAARLGREVGILHRDAQRGGIMTRVAASRRQTDGLVERQKGGGEGGH